MAITERSAVETLSPVVPVVREGAGGLMQLVRSLL